MTVTKYPSSPEGWRVKMHLKMLSGKCRPICLGLNVLSCMADTIAADDLAEEGAKKFT